LELIEGKINFIGEIVEGARKIRKLYSENFIKEGRRPAGRLLCKEITKKGVRYETIVVPSHMTEKLLHHFHNEAVGAHMGASKLIGKLSQRFYWDGIIVDSKRWCNACRFCRQRKSVANTKAGLPQQMPPTTELGQIIAIDLAGPLPETANGNKYIVTIMDTFSRYVSAVPVQAMKANMDSLVWCT
jgi:hypothetical protein